MKYLGLSIIIRNEEEFNRIKEFLGELLYLDFQPQMIIRETGIIIHFYDTEVLSIGHVGCAEAQRNKFKCRTVEFNKFFKIK